MARGLTIAIWVFCVNLVFTIFASIDPFGAGLDYGLGMEIVDMANNSSAIQSVSFLGIPEMIQVTNMLISLVVGPLSLVPVIMNLIGVTGIINTGLTAAVWIIYGWFMFQIVTGRMLGDAK